MKISDIKIGKRFRKDIGDLESLKNSIKELGLLQPIVVDEDNNLIAGYRRLMAFKELGKKDILVNVVNIENSLRGEYDENSVRKDFAPSEAVAIWGAMESYQGKKGLPPNLGRREKAIKATGFSKGSLDKAKQVVLSGNNKLIAEMDRTDNVDKVYQQVIREKRIKEQVEKGKSLPDIPIEFYNKDFRDVNLKENSIDLILTDPPYPQEFLPLWQDLGIFAQKVLKPSGFLVAYTGHIHLPEVIVNLTSSLNFYWIFSLYHKGKTHLVLPRNIIARWKPILIYQKPPFKKLDNTCQDYIISDEPEKESHIWQQSESGARRLLEIFSKPGDKVLDPFAGAGTFPKIAYEMKRIAIGIEIDKDAFNITKSRFNE